MSANIEASQAQEVVQGSAGSLYATQLQHLELAEYPVHEGYYKTLPSRIQRRGVNFMIRRETQAVHGQKGGLICDALGLGKTLQALATIVERLYAVRASGGEDQKTLVVASANVMWEWVKQSERHLQAKVLRVATYHGNSRQLPNPNDYDVLVTTYGVVRREYNTNAVMNANGLFTHWIAPPRRQPGQGETMADVFQASPFEGVFDRVILDEAHNIRNRNTSTHHAVCSLNADIHWCITATPIWNKVEDLYALLKFIGASPLDMQPVFDSTIAHRMTYDPPAAMNYLRNFMLPIELRRTKEELNLPPLTEDIMWVELGETERLFYDALMNFSRDTVVRLFQMEKWLRKTGWAKAHTSLGNRARQCILSIILRLRQACVHPQMAIDACKMWRSAQVESAAQATLLGEPRLLQEAAGRLTQLLEARGQEGNQEECCVCLSEPPGECLVPCGHTLCATCAAMLFAIGGNMQRCPVCRGTIEDHRPIEEALKEQEDAMDTDRTDSAAAGDDDDDDEVWVERTWDKNSSKIEAMLNHLKEKLRQDPTTKALVFSQWRGSLTSICKALTASGITFLRVDGTVTNAKVRSDYQDRFNEDPSIQVMVCSLNCSSEGINLQGANVVYIVDPWWTDAKEKQAGNRAHRVGQTRAVEIHHIIARNTIEENILDLQKRKREVVDAANGTRELNMGWENQMRLLLDLRNLE